jgi:dipeptidyl aminopeptidase/acylaminoacyl peptidase
VGTRRVFESQLALAQDGGSLAYIVEAPNTETNQNEYRLYLRSSKRTERKENGQVLFASDAPIRGLTWARAANTLVFLAHSDGQDQIVVMDPKTGRQEIVVESKTTLTSFSVTSRADMFAYSTSTVGGEGPTDAEYETHGYPVIWGKGIVAPSTRISRVLVRRKRNDKAGSQVFSGVGDQAIELPEMGNIRALSLSPDGRYLTFSYQSSEPPNHWKTNPYGKWLLEGFNVKPDSLGIYDFQTATFRMVFDSPSAGFGLPTVWAEDSKSFSVVALSPTDSAWEKRDRDEGFAEGIQYESYSHLFSVDAASGVVAEMLSTPAVWYQNPTLFWRDSHGPVLVRKNGKSVEWLRSGKSDWEAYSTFDLGLGTVNLESSVRLSRANAVGDSNSVVGVSENPWTPPDLFRYEFGTRETHILSALNPEYSGIALGAIEELDWHDRFGIACSGMLIKPVSYVRGRRYPLVIMAKGWGDFFVADTSFRTAFPPQLLANAGFVVLLASVPSLEKVDLNRALRQYPGQLGEGYEFISMIETGVDLLVKRGIADRLNVGIIGFSSTSWQVDFMLTQSDFPFVAASSADSGIYNYGFDWVHNLESVVTTDRAMYGGPAEGATLERWLKFSPAFNAQNVKCPLLMEYIGANTRSALEFFAALVRREKMVELFFYPRGEHVLNTPFERIASLQRNVDWFRFWMQEYEQAAPRYDPDQFARWHALREKFDRESSNRQICNLGKESPCKVRGDDGQRN